MAVLPTVNVDLDYAKFDLKDGENSKRAYLEAINADTTVERQAATNYALRINCDMNTWATIILARRLVGLAPPR